MKVNTTFILALLATLFLACSGQQNTSATAPQPADPNAPITPTTAPITPPNLSDTPVAAAGVQHYTCPNNCAGSGGATSGTCPTCGSQYTHNQAFHSQDAPATTPTTTTTPSTTPITVGGVQHYTCPNNCAGSGGANAGVCPTCGSQYAHNQAFHNQTPAAATTTTPITTGDNSVSPLFQNAPQQPQVQVPQITPASNAAGVFHYTCSNNCGGGAGTAGSCPKCGAALSHNQAYHQ